ncbi:MAG: SufD family Fe-S cluster assembly protein, partial [Gammaproteobacteria bacterium]
MSQAVASETAARPHSPAERAFREALATQAPPNPRIRSLRAAGHTAFGTTGIPDTRTEAWKYTNLRALSRRGFSAPGPVALPDREAVAVAAIDGLTGPRLVFVNGRYVPELSDLQTQPGLALLPLAELCADEDAAVPDSLEQLGDVDRHPFAALNQGLLEHGMVLRTEAGATPERPVYLLFLSVPGAEPQACHPRILIETAAQSSLTVLEHYAATGSSQNLTNAVTQIALGAASRVRHYRIQDEAAAGFHIGGLFARVGKDARLESHNLHFGG